MLKSSKNAKCDGFFFEQHHTTTTHSKENTVKFVFLRALFDKSDSFDKPSSEFFKLINLDETFFVIFQILKNPFNLIGLESVYGVLKANLNNVCMLSISKYFSHIKCKRLRLYCISLILNVTLMTGSISHIILNVTLTMIYMLSLSLMF